MKTCRWALISIIWVRNVSGSSIVASNNSRYVKSFRGNNKQQIWKKKKDHKNREATIVVSTRSWYSVVFKTFSFLHLVVSADLLCFNIQHIKYQQRLRLRSNTPLQILQISLMDTSPSFMFHISNTYSHHPTPKPLSHHKYFQDLQLNFLPYSIPQIHLI